MLHTGFTGYTELHRVLQTEQMQHRGKHGPVPTFLRGVAPIKFKLS